MLEELETAMSAQTIPAKYVRLVTPTDATNFLEGPCRGILLAADGPVAVRMENQKAAAAVVIPLLVAGVIHPISCWGIEDTGTTATSVAVFW